MIRTGAGREGTIQSLNTGRVMFLADRMRFVARPSSLFKHDGARGQETVARGVPHGGRSGEPVPAF